MWAPLAAGAYRSWPLAVALLLVALSAAAWLAGELREARLTWRRTPLDLPLALLAALVVVQLLLGNRPLVAWALAPPPATVDLVAVFPAPVLAAGTVAPRQTLDSLLIFTGYATVYLLVVQLVRSRRDLGRLVRTLVLVGGVMAFLALLDYLTGQTWLLAWLRDHPFGGRASGTYVNPDHFAAWCAMLVPLGLGWLATRAGDGRRGSVAATLSIRELREQAVRRYLPLVAVVVMTLALVFTLSRGGVIALATGLLVFLVLLRATGRLRRSLLIIGTLLVAVAAYGSWIGFGPLLARIARDGASGRLVQALSSLPMLRDFPLWGVGLGAYRDIYVRYQPAALDPGLVYYPYAHNDLLQLAVELGVPGALLCLFVGWRIAGDLLGAHLLGRGTCPVDGGAGEQARRHDRYSVGIAAGALSGVAAVVAHSALDFSVRIAANGLLAATLLGIATVALHTRLAPDHERLLSAAPAVALSRAARRALAVAAALALAGWAAYWVHIARVRTAEDALRAAPAAERPARADAVLALDARNASGLQARAAARQAAALAAWTAPPAPGVDRAAVATALLASGRGDLRAALAVTPTSPALHLDLAWLEATDAVVHDRAGAAGLAAALAHAARAVALAPDDASVYATTARLAYTLPELGLRAAREAARRRPAALPALVATYAGFGLSDAEWLSMVDGTAADRLELASLLEARRLGDEALAAYRAAVEVAPPAQEPLVRWALAGALGRRGADRAAAEELQQALAAAPGNPELERALAASLARLGDPSALDHFRLALATMRTRAAAVERSPFDLRDARLAAWLRAHGGDDLDAVLRYQRALARYLTERKLWDQALAEWRDVVQAAPGDADAHFGYATTLDATGATSEAIEHYRTAVALAPRAAVFRSRLAARLWETEQYYQAINEWRTLLDHAPADIDAHVALARALEKVGERTEAYRHYRAVLELRPNDSTARQALARFR